MAGDCVSRESRPALTITPAGRGALNLETKPSMMRGEFEREQTIREALSLDASGHLVVDHTVIVDPFPGGSTKQLDVPLSWTCTYGKTQ